MNSKPLIYLTRNAACGYYSVNPAPLVKLLARLNVDFDVDKIPFLTLAENDFQEIAKQYLQLFPLASFEYEYRIAHFVEPVKLWAEYKIPQINDIDKINRNYYLGSGDNSFANRAIKLNEI